MPHCLQAIAPVKHSMIQQRRPPCPDAVQSLASSLQVLIEHPISGVSPMSYLRDMNWPLRVFSPQHAAASHSASSLQTLCFSCQPHLRPCHGFISPIASLLSLTMLHLPISCGRPDSQPLAQLSLFANMVLLVSAVRSRSSILP